MEEKVNQVLESIGLCKNEIKIYLDLVRNSSSTALEISKRTKIHRSNTYDSLRNLAEKGFIQEIIKDNKKLFVSQNPEKIKNYVVQKQHEVESILPNLCQFFKGNNDESSIITCRGIFAAREAAMDLLKINKPIKVFGAPKEVIDMLGLGFLKEYHKNRIKSKIWMHHIYNSDVIERVQQLNKMKYTDARYIDKGHDSSVTTNICGDVVLIWVFTNPVSTIIIRDKSIAETYGKFFDALWKKTKKIY